MVDEDHFESLECALGALGNLAEHHDNRALLLQKTSKDSTTSELPLFLACIMDEPKFVCHSKVQIFACWLLENLTRGPHNNFDRKYLQNKSDSDEIISMKMASKFLPLVGKAMLRQPYQLDLQGSACVSISNIAQLFPNLLQYLRDKGFPTLVAYAIKASESSSAESSNKNKIKEAARKLIELLPENSFQMM